MCMIYISHKRYPANTCVRFRSGFASIKIKLANSSVDKKKLK